MKTKHKYILDKDGKTPILCDDLIKWGSWLETENRTVARTYVVGGYVSTVFLGLDHGDGVHAPMLFETLVFNGEHDGEMTRCATWKEAEEMHKNMVKKCGGAGLG